MTTPHTDTLRTKLRSIVLLTTFAALLVTATAMAIYDAQSYRESGMRDLATQAEILARASAAALSFDDRAAAAGYLSYLKAKPAVSAAAIYDSKGALFASYTADGANAELPQLPEADGTLVQSGNLVLFKRIVNNGEILGAVYLKAQYDLWQRVRGYVAIIGTVMVMSLLGVFLLSSRLHTAVMRQLQAIVDVAHQVVDRRDFSLRADKMADDEIGYLVDAFNNMLDEVGRRTEAIENANAELNREVGERRSAEAALRDSQRRNSTLVAATSAVVWSADGEGRFVNAQSSWAAFTGQTESEYLGPGWRMAFQLDDSRAFIDAWKDATVMREPFSRELRLWHHPSGRYRYVSLRAVPIVESDGRVSEWIGTVTDVDDRRQAEEELHQLNAELEARVSTRTSELEAANKELESFSYSVSHDLRAPLRAVIAFSKLLWESHGEQFDAEARRKLEIIRSEGSRMALLIDDLLAFSRLGRKAMRKVELDMTELARAVFERLRSQHEGPQPQFRLGPLPKAVADRTLIEQVWANFLSNALKFSSRRETPVIEVGAITDRAEHIYFVRDNGAGFDPAYKAKLFGVFQRLHDASEFPGTGVGLALVHRIIARHGGRVWADGQPDAGATFHFTVPRGGETNGSV
jgi:PAS domain S-box-containing protein